MKNEEPWRPLLVLFCLTCTLVFAVAVAIAADLGVRAEAPGLPCSAEAEVPPVSGEGQSAYLLREQNGRLCVYAQGEESIPMMVTDIETADLRAADRELLRAGLGAATREELLSLLEDFGS